MLDPHTDPPESRARRLLQRVLSPRQRKELATLGCFTVDVHARGRFCILTRGGYNVVHLSTGTRYCAYPRSLLPPSDVVLGQKLVLEHCPEHFFAVANMAPGGLGPAGLPPIVRALALPRSNFVEDGVSMLVADLGCLMDVHRVDNPSAAPDTGDFQLILLDVDALRGRSHLLAHECHLRFPQAQRIWLAAIPAGAPCNWRAACTSEFPIFSKSCFGKAWAPDVFRTLLPAMFASAAPTTARLALRSAPRQPRFESRQSELLAKLCAWQASKRR